METVTQGMAGLSTVSAEQQMTRRGTSGKTVRLNANYVMLKGRSEGVFQYAVSFEPVVENKNMRFQLLNEHRAIIGNTGAFDGSILYLPQEDHQYDIHMHQYSPDRWCADYCQYHAGSTGPLLRMHATSQRHLSLSSELLEAIVETSH